MEWNPALRFPNACDDLQLKVKEVPTEFDTMFQKAVDTLHYPMIYGASVRTHFTVSEETPLVLWSSWDNSIATGAPAIGMRVLNELRLDIDGLSLVSWSGLTGRLLGMLGMSLCSLPWYRMVLDD